MSGVSIDNQFWVKFSHWQSMLSEISTKNLCLCEIQQTTDFEWNSNTLSWCWDKINCQLKFLKIVYQLEFHSKSIVNFDRTFQLTINFEWSFNWQSVLSENSINIDKFSISRSSKFSDTIFRSRINFEILNLIQWNYKAKWK